MIKLKKGNVIVTIESEYGILSDETIVARWIETDPVDSDEYIRLQVDYEDMSSECDVMECLIKRIKACIPDNYEKLSIEECQEVIKNIEKICYGD